LILKLGHGLDHLPNFIDAHFNTHGRGPLPEKSGLDYLVDDLLFESNGLCESFGDITAELIAELLIRSIIGLLKLLEGNFLTVNDDGRLFTVPDIGAHAPKDENQGNNDDNYLNKGRLCFFTKYLQHEDSVWVKGLRQGISHMGSSITFRFTLSFSTLQGKILFPSSARQTPERWLKSNGACPGKSW